MHLFIKILRVVGISEYRRAFLRTRVAASTEHDAILGGLGIDTVVDLGANRGQFALCARHLFPKARIFSFEPLAAAVRRWRQVFAGDARAALFEVAIAERAGSADLHVARWDSSSSLLPIGQAQQDNYPLTHEVRRVPVTMVRLADRLAREDISGRALLKLDVQGSELSALRGCSDLLPLFSFVYVEASFIELYIGQALAGEVAGYLYEHGFLLQCVSNLSSGKSGKPIQGDFLFGRLPAHRDTQESLHSTTS